MTVKTDNERCVLWWRRLSKLRAANGGQRFSVETSPAPSSASNGVVEREVQGQVRVLRRSVGEKLGVKLDTCRSIWPWLVEYASFMVSRERPRFFLGEKILWRRRQVGRNLGKLTCLCEDGIILGEYIVVTHRSTPLLMTTQNCGPSFANEPILASVP